MLHQGGTLVCIQESVRPASVEGLLTVLLQRRSDGIPCNGWSAFVSCDFNRLPSSFQTWWEQTRSLQQKEKRKCFDSLFMLIAWLIWKGHNRRLFDRRSHSVMEVLDCIKSEIHQWIQASAVRLGCLRVCCCLRVCLDHFAFCIFAFLKENF